MGAALRTSSNKRVQLSNFDLEADTYHQRGPTTEVGFQVSFKTYDLPEAEESCWISLFSNPTIAQGFPVRKRDNEEQGLELPLEMMAALGGARHITSFEEGLVLKGFSAMFVPVKRYNDSVQWHFIFDKQGKRLSYGELTDLSSNRALLDDVSHEFLRGARAFLGWWKAAETHLGTQEAAYGNIDWSPAKEPVRPIKLSGGEIGFERVVTAKISFSMGAKDGPFHYSRSRPFQQLMNCARDTPVTLYDTQDRRAWLVPAVDVMLHIVLTRHHLSPPQVRGKLVEFVTAAPESGFNAEEAILQNQDRCVYEADSPWDRDYSFKDAIIDIWSQIERLMEKEDLVNGTCGATLHGTTRTRLHGWEYMSLVHEKNYRRKEALLEKSNGGWVDLIDDIDTLVLMGTGFGDVIKPVSNLNRLCHKWRTLPHGRDYLAAVVPILEILYAEAGSRTSRKHLSTNHLQWHKGSMLFEHCTEPKSDPCECDRTQQIYHESHFRTFGQVRPPGKLEPMGCVIFGQAHHPFKRTKIITDREDSSYDSPNTLLHNLKRHPPTPLPDEPLIPSNSNSVPCFPDAIDERKHEVPQPPNSPETHNSEKETDTSKGGNTSRRAFTPTPMTSLLKSMIVFGNKQNARADATRHKDIQQ